MNQTLYHCNKVGNVELSSPGFIADTFKVQQQIFQRIHSNVAGKCFLRAKIMNSRRLKVSRIGNSPHSPLHSGVLETMINYVTTRFN